MTKPKPRTLPTATDEPKPDAAPKSKSGAKCVVACKIPNGLILRIFKMVPTDLPVMGGGMKTVQQAQPFGEPVRVNGPAVPFGKIPKYIVTESGFALTSNVDKDFFDEWMRQNREHDAVKNKLIFAHASSDGVQGLAEDHREARSNLEPLVPDTDPRNPRAQQNLTAPKTADEVKGRKSAA